jgi:glutamate carboxypeptidase
MSNATRILEHVRARKDDLVAFLASLVDAESPSSQPVTHGPARRAIVNALEALDMHVRAVRTPGGAAHVYARPAARRRHHPRQLLIGHYDTVWPVGTLGSRPFKVSGGRITGPGVFDMKGGIAQIVFALATIRELELELPLDPIVFINSDEEIGSRSSSRYIELLARRAERAFILEPSMGPTGRLKTARKGIGRFTVTVYGKAAHAGLNPEEGRSAILELALIIQQLFDMNDPDRGISVNVGTVDGGIQPNVVAPHSRAIVDVRVPTVADGEAIEARIRALRPSMPECRVVVEGGIGRPSMERTPRNRALWRQAEALGAELGLDLEEAFAGGGSDGNTTSLYTATLDGLGPVGDGAHAEHEFLDIDKTLERTALLAMLLCAPPVEPVPGKRQP